MLFISILLVVPCWALSNDKRSVNVGTLIRQEGGRLKTVSGSGCRQTNHVNDVRGLNVCCAAWLVRPLLSASLTCNLNTVVNDFRLSISDLQLMICSTIANLFGMFCCSTRG